MKTFRDQFIECRKDGFHGQGRFLYSPNDMPLLKKLNPQDIRKLEKKRLVACLRFDGICESGNEKCRKMRGEKDK